VEMRIGSLEESITVTGESPVVDVQTSGRREVVGEELIESLPTGRNFQLLAGTVPAVSTGVFDVGGSSTMWTGGSLLTHGSQTRDSRTLIDGMVADAMFGGGQCSCIYDNEAQTQEVSVQVSGGSAENQTGGVLVNRIPKTGGNQYRGEFVGLWSNSSLQADNIVKSFPGRITGQATKNDRFTLLFDWANKVRGHRGLSATVQPEASDRQTQPASHIAQAKWTRTQSSKLLLEGGYTNTYIGSLFKYQPDIALATCRSAFAACPAGTNYGAIAKQDLILNTRWSASMPTAVATAPAHQPGTSHVIIGSVSYVSGAHNIKVGIQNRSGWLKDLRRDINGDIVQQYRNGVPSQVLVLNTPLQNTVNLNADFGFFAQDTWTMRRLTLNPGL